MATDFPYEESRKVEFFDITNPALTCRLPNFPIQLTGSTGGFTAEGPLICSGYDYDKVDSCYHINSATGQFLKTKVSLKYKRWDAASIVTNTGLWILGGYGYGFLKSTELVSATGVEDKNSLPIALGYACIVKINATTGIFTGGHKNKASKSTYFLDLTNFDIKPGPDMISERYRHGCSSFTFNGHDIAIVSYGDKEDYGFKSRLHLNSTEYLDTSKEDPKWEQGTVCSMQHCYFEVKNVIIVL